MLCQFAISEHLQGCMSSSFSSLLYSGHLQEGLSGHQKQELTLASEADSKAFPLLCFLGKHRSSLSTEICQVSFYSTPVWWKCPGSPKQPQLLWIIETAEDLSHLGGSGHLWWGLPHCFPSRLGRMHPSQPICRFTSIENAPTGFFPSLMLKVHGMGRNYSSLVYVLWSPHPSGSVAVALLWYSLFCMA